MSELCQFTWIRGIFTLLFFFHNYFWQLDLLSYCCKHLWCHIVYSYPNLTEIHPIVTHRTKEQFTFLTCFACNNAIQLHSRGYVGSLWWLIDLNHLSRFSRGPVIVNEDITLVEKEGDTLIKNGLLYF